MTCSYKIAFCPGHLPWLPAPAPAGPASRASADSSKEEPSSGGRARCAAAAPAGPVGSQADVLAEPLAVTAARLQPGSAKAAMFEALQQVGGQVGSVQAHAAHGDLAAGCVYHMQLLLRQPCGESSQDFLGQLPAALCLHAPDRWPAALQAGPSGLSVADVWGALEGRGEWGWSDSRSAKASIASTLAHDVAFVRLGQGVFAVRCAAPHVDTSCCMQQSLTCS